MSQEHFASIAKRLSGDDHGAGGLKPVQSGADYFFEGAQRKHQLETLYHLTAFGDLLLIVSGEAGSGKTALLNALKREIGSDLHALLMAVDEDLDLVALTKRLASISSVIASPSDDTEQLISRCLESYASLSQSEDKRTTLIIDDADKIDDSVLLDFLQRLGIPSNNYPLTVVLSGSGDFSLLREQLPSDALHDVQLPRLKRDEIRQYIENGLLHVGYQERLALSDSKLDALLVRSHGLPANINTYMGSIIFGRDVSGQPVNGDSRTRLPVLVLAMIVVALLGSFIFVAHQHNLFAGLMDIENEHEAALSDLEAQRERLQKLDMALAQSERFEQNVVSEDIEVALYDDSRPDQPQGVIEQPSEDVDASELEAERLEKSDYADEPVNVVAESNDEPDDAASESVEVVDSSVVVSSRSSLESPKEDDGRKLISTEQGGSDDLNARRISIEKPERHSAYRDSDWLRNQLEASFTLQVLGSHNEETAQRFVEQNVGVDLFYVESIYKGKPWFVVLHGLFPERTEARDARGQLPDKIAREKPWVRSLDGLVE